MTDTDNWQTEEADISTEEETNETAEGGYIDIELMGYVDTPPPSTASVYTEIIQALIANQDDDKLQNQWLAMGTGGRQKNTVQSGLVSASTRFGVKVETKTAEVDGEPRVYVRLKQANTDTPEGIDEEQ